MWIFRGALLTTAKNGKKRKQLPKTGGKKENKCSSAGEWINYGILTQWKIA